MPYVRRLIWDAWNVAHIARHKVTPEEAEQVCHGDPVELQSYKQRIILIGPTHTGRMVAVVLDPEPQRGVYYPVTARPASRKERQYYQTQKGGENL